MNFESVRDWLARKLEHADDSEVGSGGTSLAALREDAGARTVTPGALADVPTEIGKAIRYVRERRGWSRCELAELADIDESDVLTIETSPHPVVAPRTVSNLARVCQFSTQRFQLLANHIALHESTAANDASVRFAARSGNISSVTRQDLEAVRLLVVSLSETATNSDDEKPVSGRPYGP
jgi:transcriptional regulator with XRE-family HTH domain